MEVSARRRLGHASALVLALSAAFGAGAAPADPESHMKATEKDMKWWRDAKFGVFICWGPCSLKAVEIGWSRHGPRPGRASATRGVPKDVYDNLYRRFNPTKFDAKEWVDIIKASGARYMIFLTKHHDGFCLFDSKLTDYKITNTPFGRDVTAELARACQEAGIRIFWYYSQPDWYHPDYRTKNHARYIEYLHGQVGELCTNYGKIDGIWFDGLGGRAADWETPKLFRMIRTLQPGTIINNRAGVGGDFDTPEQRLGKFQLHRPWESCITMGGLWSWCGGRRVKTLKQCLHLLIRCAGGGGNLALDTGPMPDGRIMPLMEKNYRDMGAWLRDHGQSIYATTGGPYKPGGWGVSTRKGSTIYLHVLKWPGDTLELPPPGRKVLSCRALTGGDATFEQDEEGLAISLAEQFHDETDTVVVLDLDGSAMDIEPMAVATMLRGLVSVGKKATASGEWNAQYSAAKAFDGDESTRWGAEPASRSGWLAVDLGRPTTFDRVAILEGPWNRVKKFRLEYKDAETWKTFHEGDKLGSFDRRFEPVTARHVRLSILEATHVPTIWEVRLFAPKSK
jgi:alpha-L-fucosidase